MGITVAESAGFCFGVSRAVKMVEEKTKEGKVFTLGPVIHNSFETERLRALGAEILTDVNNLSPNDRVIIRSHGIPESAEYELSERGAKVFDATCPFVKKIHKIVKEYTENGYTAVIVGDSGHPEVLGIAGRCMGKTVCVTSEEEAREELCGEEKLCVVAQTTANKDNYKKIIKIIKNTCKDAVFFDTICDATRKRQSEAEELSKKSDVMIVIGDRNSRNTNKLLEVSKRYCKNAYLIENAREVCGLRCCGEIGITAGASTPDWIIKEVVKTMEENMVKTEGSFEEELEKSLKTLSTGDVVSGTVIRVTPTEVYVDLGYKADGVISESELSDDPTLKPEDLVHVGDTVEAFVYRVSDVEGTVGLSVKKLKSIKGWDEIQKAFEEKQILQCKIVEVVNGGVIAISNGSRIFIPASQASDRYVADLNTLIGKEVPVRIRDINKGRRKILGSVRDVLSERKETLLKEFWAKIDAGQTEFEGTVKTLTNFGAFVDLGGIDGLIHISELSWNHIKHPSEVLKEGDTVNVRILEVNRETGKISLGYRKAEDNPWEIVRNRIKVNDVIKAKVVRLVPFGAFVEIIPGVDGLIHISQIANKRIEKPADELTVGEEIEALVTDINWENRKIALSIRALLPDEKPVAPEALAEEAEEENKIVASTDDMDALKEEEPVKEPETDAAEEESEAPAEEAADAE